MIAPVDYFEFNPWLLLATVLECPSYLLPEWQQQVPKMVHPATENSWLKESVTSSSNCAHEVLFLYFYYFHDSHICLIFL